VRPCANRASGINSRLDWRYSQEQVMVNNLVPTVRRTGSERPLIELRSGELAAPILLGDR
jgi:hypothetical protein